ncbi:MAG: transposase [Oscillospiraceae bacterium]|nr:transposase [Oscillospiraceae bacterium]
MKELPKRKQNRISGFDYSAPHAYFITVCTQDRRNLFWQNVGAVIGRPEDVQLSSYGKIAEKAIQSIPEHYNMVCVEKYVVMPDHIHMLLRIKPEENGRPMTAPTIARVVNQTKGVVSKQLGFSVWQKGFYDHVVRTEEDFRDIWQYIEGNPLKWEEDMQQRCTENRRR